MRHNGRPRMYASRMRPNHLNLRPGEPRMVVCPDCGRWHGLRRSIVSPHWDDSDISLCPGSGQRICVDLDPAEWAQRLSEAIAEADLIRPASGPVGAPAPPPVLAVTQLATANR